MLVIAVLTFTPLINIDPAERVALTVALPTRIKEALTRALLPAVMVRPDTPTLTFAPTLTSVATLTVAGSLAVAKVPDVMFVAFAAIAIAFV